MFSKRVQLLPRLLCVITLVLPAFYINVTPATSIAFVSGQSQEWTPTIADDGFVYYEDQGGVRCRPATAEESLAIAGRDPNIQLHVIKSGEVSTQAAGDVSIELRATPQLDQYPQAKQGFLNAAARWSSVIQAHTPIKIIVDVDFGPTRFGTAFPPDVLGSTGTQAQLNPNGYPSIRSSLIAKADTQQEAGLYNALPVGTVPTDIGSTAGMVLPSALLRALGQIAPMADPTSEAAQLGNPPSIGFNSNFAFDFDPSNGIDPEKIDFDAVATHEIGHALGFGSRVGALEMNPSNPLAVSMLDIFRLRAGTTLSTFPTAQRVLSSGGNQMFFAGTGDIALSTGRLDGSGGDGYQAAHWKRSSSGLLGIMDPGLARGERNIISQNDLFAFDTFGYTVRSGGVSAAPLITSLSADLRGDVLTLTGQATDTQGDIAQAQTTLLSDSGSTVAQSNPTAVNFSGQTSLGFNLQFAGLNSYPAATKVSLVLIDQQGNRSQAVTADFSAADPGGPTLKSVSYAGRLFLKGGGFAGHLEIEINGVVVATRDNESNKKIKIGGSAAAFNIRSGDNRVRIKNGSLRSNVLVTLL